MAKRRGGDLLEEVEILYREIQRRTTHKGKAASLAAVWNAVQSLITGGQAVTIAAVARKIAATPEGGPSDKTIRNKSGADYRLLIGAAAKRAPASSGTRTALHTDISDPTQRAQVKLLELEVRSLRHRCDTLSAALQKLEVVADPATGVLALPPATDRPSSLSAADREIIRAFLNKMDDEGQDLPVVFTEVDSLVSRDCGRELAPMGFREVLERLVRNAG